MDGPSQNAQETNTRLVFTLNNTPKYKCYRYHEDHQRVFENVYDKLPDVNVFLPNYIVLSASQGFATVAVNSHL